MEGCECFIFVELFAIAVCRLSVRSGSEDTSEDKTRIANRHVYWQTIIWHDTNMCSSMLGHIYIYFLFVIFVFKIKHNCPYQIYSREHFLLIKKYYKLFNRKSPAIYLRQGTNKKRDIANRLGYVAFFLKLISIEYRVDNWVKLSICLYGIKCVGRIVTRSK